MLEIIGEYVLNYFSDNQYQLTCRLFALISGHLVYYVAYRRRMFQFYCDIVLLLLFNGLDGTL